MKTQDISVFMQGYFDAAMHGVSRDENPYPAGDKRRMEWFDGYGRWEQEEQRKDDEIGAYMGGEPS